MSDIALPPPPPPRPAWMRPPPSAGGLRPALTGLATALHLAAVELRLTTDGVRALADPEQQLALTPVLQAINEHISLAAHGVERLVGVLGTPAEDNDDKGGRTDGQT